MRIAVNTRVLLKNRLEGVGWFTYEVTRRLVDRHPDWEFLFLFDRPYHRDFVFGPNVRPLQVAPPARHPFLWYWWFQRSLPRVFRREQPDVFLSPDGHCSLRTSVPTVMVLHDIAHVHFPQQVRGMVRWYYDRYIPRYLQHADRVVTVSDYSKEDILKTYGPPRADISVCGNGARPGFRPLSDAEKESVRQRYTSGQPYFFYLGSVNPRKNVHRLIEAFDLFKKETGAAVKLLIGGRFGWLTGAVKDAYDRAAFQDDIIFLNYIPEEELPDIMGAALALTYVSLFEGFGLPLLEAMEAEVPVLTSPSSSLPEVAGEAALYVDPADTRALASALQRLCRESDLRQLLVERGRAQRRKFSWEHTADVVDQAILQLASE